MNAKQICGGDIDAEEDLAHFSEAMPQHILNV